MPVAVYMEWDGVTPAQYDTLRKHVRWEEHAPEGGLLHIASFNETGILVTDVWECAEQYQAFVESRLMPGVAEVGIGGSPRVSIHPLHRLYTPAFEAVHSN